MEHGGSPKIGRGGLFVPPRYYIRKTLAGARIIAVLEATLTTEDRT